MPRAKGVRREEDDNIVDQITDVANSEVETEEEELRRAPLLSSGSTLLNLACSDTPDGAFPVGAMTNIVGDSNAGKSVEALTCLAEAANSEYFAEHEKVLDDTEIANHFDLAYMFGNRAAGQIVAPNYHKESGLPVFSRTVEDFQGNVFSRFKAGKPFIYIEDSLDAITTEADEAKVYGDIEKREKGEDIKGSYNMSKPKKMSEMLGPMCQGLANTNSLVIIVSQTRDDINPMTFKKKTRSGGKALKFYAAVEIWTAVIKQFKKGPKESALPIGALCRFKVERTKLTGKSRTVDLPIYYDYGIDNIGSCIDFLLKVSFWGKDKESIVPTGLGVAKCGREKLIKIVEKENLELKLDQLTAKAWHIREDSIKLNRKRKYQ